MKDFNFDGTLIINAAALKFVDAARTDKDYQAVFAGIFITTTEDIAASDGFQIARSLKAISGSTTPGFADAVTEFHGSGVTAIAIKPAAKNLPALPKAHRNADARVDFATNLIHWPGDKVIPFTILEHRVPDFNRVIPERSKAVSSTRIPFDLLKAASVMKHWPGAHDARHAMAALAHWRKSGSSSAMFTVDDDTHLYGLVSVVNADNPAQFVDPTNEEQ